MSDNVERFETDIHTSLFLLLLLLLLLLFIYYARSITISNTACFVSLHIYLFSKITYLLYTQVKVSFSCYFIFYEFSRCMLSTNLLKILMYLLIRVSLLTGQFSVRNISAFSLSLPASQDHNHITYGLLSALLFCKGTLDCL